MKKLRKQGGVYSHLPKPPDVYPHLSLFPVLRLGHHIGDYEVRLTYPRGVSFTPFSG